VPVVRCTLHDIIAVSQFYVELQAAALAHVALDAAGAGLPARPAAGRGSKDYQQTALARCAENLDPCCCNYQMVSDNAFLQIALGTFAS
jgi:hypothetical protein